MNRIAFEVLRLVAFLIIWNGGMLLVQSTGWTSHWQMFVFGAIMYWTGLIDSRVRYNG